MKTETKPDKLVRSLNLEPCRDYEKRPMQLEVKSIQTGVTYSVTVLAVSYRRIRLSFKGHSFSVLRVGRTVWQGGKDQNIMTLKSKRLETRVNMLYTDHESALANISEYLDLVFDMTALVQEYKDFVAKCCNLVPLDLLECGSKFCDFYQYSKEESVDIYDHASFFTDSLVEEMAHSGTYPETSELQESLLYPYSDLEIPLLLKSELLNLLPENTKVNEEKFNQNLSRLQIALLDIFCDIHQNKETVDRDFTLYLSWQNTGRSYLVEGSCAGIRPDLHPMKYREA